MVPVKIAWVKAQFYLCLTKNHAMKESCDSSVGIVLGYKLYDWGSRVWLVGGLVIFPFTTASRTGLGPTQPIKWLPEALSLGVKQPGCEADHPPISSAEVQRMSGAIPPLPQYAFMACCLVKKKHKNNFTFYLTMPWRCIHCLIKHHVMKTV
jgi:hypothetical protein